MRITGNRLIDLASTATSNGQAKVAASSAEVSSGLRVATPSDDPTAWLAAHRAGLQRALSQGTGSAIQASRDRLDDTDRVLSVINDAVSQARTIVVQGASASYNANDRAALGAEARALFATVLGAANTKAADGEYLLAGSRSLTQPFDSTTGAYQGDATVRSVPTSASTNETVTLAGTELTATRGVDVIPLIDRIATALAANDTATLSAALPDLETALKQVSLARSKTGGVMNVLDSTMSAHRDLEQSISTRISNYVESDTVSAASELAKATQAFEVSRAVSAHIIAMLAPTSG